MKQKELIITIIFTFIVIMIWVAADITHSNAEIPVSPQLQQALTPIEPTFNQTTLAEIDKRESLQNQ